MNECENAKTCRCGEYRADRCNYIHSEESLSTTSILEAQTFLLGSRYWLHLYGSYKVSSKDREKEDIYDANLAECVDQNVHQPSVTFTVGTFLVKGIVAPALRSNDTCEFLCFSETRCMTRRR